MDKTKRKPNFSEGEKLRMVEEYEREFTVLTSKFSSVVTNKKKHETWLKITESMNSRNTMVVRTGDDFLKKWQNLCSTMKDEYRVYRKEHARTGGGPPPKEPSDISKKIAAILGEDDPNIYGISGGIDSSTKHDEYRRQTHTDSRSSSPNLEDSSSSVGNKSQTEERKRKSADYAAFSVLRPSTSKLPSPCPSAEETGKGKKRGKQDEDNGLLHLQKELLTMEKQRSKLEIDKLQLEKTKLNLEIEVLKLKRQKLRNNTDAYTVDYEERGNLSYANLRV